MTDAGRKTGDSKIDRLAMEYEDKYGQPLTDAQIERLDQLSGSSEYGNYAIDTSGFASDAPFGSPQRESDLNAYMKNLQDERNAKRANFTLENLGISPDQTSPLTQPTAPQDPMQGGIGGLIDSLQGQTIPQPPMPRGPVIEPPQPPMPTRRPLPTPPLNPNRFISVEEFEGRSPSPSRPDDMSDGLPLPPQMPDRIQQLREALRQKQSPRKIALSDGVQRREIPRRGKGSLGGIIGRLRQQMDQRREIPLPRRYDEEVDDSNFEFTYGKDRLGMPVMSVSPRRNVDPNRFISVEEFERGGARPQKPDMEEIRRQIMRGVNVRGIRF